MWRKPQQLPRPQVPFALWTIAHGCISRRIGMNLCLLAWTTLAATRVPLSIAYCCNTHWNLGDNGCQPILVCTFVSTRREHPARCFRRDTQAAGKSLNFAQITRNHKNMIMSRICPAISVKNYRIPLQRYSRRLNEIESSKSALIPATVLHSLDDIEGLVFWRVGRGARRYR